MKILITNTVCLNGGDAAILLSIMNLLRTEFGQNTEFIIYDSQPKIASKYYPNLNFRKLIYAKSKDLPSMTKYPEKAFIARVLQHILNQLLIISASIRLDLFYVATWCWKHGFQWIAKLLINKDDIQDLEHYSSADLIVSTGGTYLVESYPLIPRIFDYKISLLLERPLAFYTQSLGPFLNKKNQHTFRNIFNDSILVLLRDELSLKHLQDLKVDENKLYVSSDVVFSMRSQIISTKKIPSNFKQEKSKLKIAISVRSWHLFKQATVEAGMNNFRCSMCALTKYLVEKHQAEITYISTCQGIDEYWMDDSKFAMEIYNLLPNDVQKNVSVNNSFHMPQTLLEMLTDYELVIGTRMHMCILSLAAGTPVFPIAYEFKTKELFHRLDMGKWIHDIETINEESLITSVEAFISNLDKIKQKLMLKVNQEHERAVESGQLLKKYFYEYQNSRMR
jgi:colanic acid/amylovoran biosynthesis protein